LLLRRPEPLRRFRADSPVGVFLLTVLLLVPVYAVTAERVEFNVDSIANATPAWQLAQHGNVWLDDFEGGPHYQLVDGRLVSNRPPGAAFFAVPFYRALSSGEEPSQLPATVAAVAAASAAMGLLALAFRRLVSARLAVLAAVAFGLGTPTWGSAHELWQHGPAQLWVAAGLLALAHERYAIAGTAFGLGLLTRPPVGVIALVSGLGASWTERRMTPALRMGIAASIGLGVYLAYNAIVLDTWSPIGGYRDLPYLQAGAVGTGDYLKNLVGTLLSPSNGMLVWTPALAILIGGIPKAWNESPRWARIAFVAGVAYVLFHARLNPYTATGPVGYRQTIEGLTIMSPILLLSYQHWIRREPTRRRIFAVSVAASIATQLALQL
jgi:hypothetical protein